MKTRTDVQLALLDVEDELRLQLLGQIGLRQVEERHETLESGRHDRWASGEANLEKDDFIGVKNIVNFFNTVVVKIFFYFVFER